jgi:DNA polymerase III subunit gamma/tau
VTLKSTQYQVIARKYRPQTFSSIVGQEAIVTTLKNALRFNRLAHAYLFAGSRGTGKTTLARVLAKALSCSHPTADFEPCNECSSCLDITAGRSMDVLEIDGASNRGIDDIRRINETIGYAPASGKYKIYIIDEVHMLTKEAFNALLKTLEEPPGNVKFFFATTEPHKVLPTIVSRCQRFDLSRIPFEALKQKLSWIAQDLNIACEEDVFSLIANLSEGSLRDAESLFDQVICYAEHPINAAKVATTLGILPRSAFFSLDKAFDEQNLCYAFELAGVIFSSGKDLSYFIDNLIEHYRCLLKLKLGALAEMPTARLKEQYLFSATLYDEEQCLYILDFLIHWQQQIHKTPFKRITLEMILLHIIRSKHRLTLPALIKRLNELEQKAEISNLYSAQLKVGEFANAEDGRFASEPAQATEEIQPPPQIVESRELSRGPNPKFEPDRGIAPSHTPLRATEPLSPTEKWPEAPTLEETLINKIREKIDSSPPPIEAPTLIQQPSQNSPAQASSDLCHTPLLLSKAKWEAITNDIQNLHSPVERGITEEAVPRSVIQEEKNKQSSQATATQTPQPSMTNAGKAIDSAGSISPSNTISQSRYDTLIRFAAVELEGTIK